MPHRLPFSVCLSVSLRTAWARDPFACVILFPLWPLAALLVWWTQGHPLETSE